jgi:hypothetical protein
LHSDGTVALLYQQLTIDNLWNTHVILSSNGTVFDRDFLLSKFPDGDSAFDPYIGDYTHLQAVGRNFFGVFSALNTPDGNFFPTGVTFQRRIATSASGQKFLTDLHGTPVSPSIDPFLVRVLF